MATVLTDLAPKESPVHLYKILTTNPGLDCKDLKLPDLDHTDGFIHLSTAEQTPKTAGRFFREEFTIYLLKIRYEQIKDNIKWEESRSHGVFPHVYADNLDEVLKGEGIVQNVITLDRKEGHEWGPIVEEAVSS